MGILKTGFKSGTWEPVIIGTLSPVMTVRDRLYKNRTVMERANSNLKGTFLPTVLYVKGYKKMNFVVMMGVMLHTAIKVLQHFVLPAEQIPP